MLASMHYLRCNILFKGVVTSDKIGQFEARPWENSYHISSSVLASRHRLMAVWLVAVYSGMKRPRRVSYLL
jgi:hypothetical protein